MILVRLSLLEILSHSEIPYALSLAGTQNSERVKCVEYKLLLLFVPEQNDEMLIQNVTLKIQTSI